MKYCELRQKLLLSFESYLMRFLRGQTLMSLSQTISVLGNERILLFHVWHSIHFVRKTLACFKTVMSLIDLNFLNFCRALCFLDDLYLIGDDPVAQQATKII